MTEMTDSQFLDLNRLFRKSVPSGCHASEATCYLNAYLQGLSYEREDGTHGYQEPCPAHLVPAFWDNFWEQTWKRKERG